MTQKKFRPKVINGAEPTMAPPAPMNVVLRKDAETAARVAYATGRRDAMTTLAEEMKVLTGQFIAVDDMVESIEAAAVEFDAIIQRINDGTPNEGEVDPEAEARDKARERLILPS